MLNYLHILDQKLSNNNNQISPNPLREMKRNNRNSPNKNLKKRFSPQKKKKATPQKKESIDDKENNSNRLNSFKETNYLCENFYDSNAKSAETKIANEIDNELILKLKIDLQTEKNDSAKRKKKNQILKKLYQEIVSQKDYFHQILQLKLSEIDKLKQKLENNKTEKKEFEISMKNSQVEYQQILEHKGKQFEEEREKFFVESEKQQKEILDLQILKSRRKK